MKRHLMPETRVKRVGEAAVTGEDGVTFIPPAEHLAAFTPGVVYQIEGRIGSVVTGCRMGRAWLWRKADDALADERRVESARFAVDKAERLRDNREGWEAREAKLPAWLRDRIEFFRDQAGERFELDGWEYELVVAELAVLYDASGLAESGRIVGW